MTKTGKPGRPKTSAAERHEWAMICNRIHEAAGLTQGAVAEALTAKMLKPIKPNRPKEESQEVSLRQWGYYLTGKRSPKTLEYGAEIIRAAEKLGWYASKPFDWEYRYAAGEIPGQTLDITPVDLLADRDRKMREEAVTAAAKQALKALAALNSYPASSIADAMSEATFAEIHLQVENLWLKLGPELAFRLEYN